MEKGSGKALYTADFITQDELVGRILRSPIAHARIVSVDTSAAEALLLGGTRDAVDDFARDRTSRLGSTFGLHRFSLPQFAARVAATRLAAQSRAPASRLGAEAVAARLAVHSQYSPEVVAQAAQGAGQTRVIQAASAQEVFFYKHNV